MGLIVRGESYLRLEAHIFLLGSVRFWLVRRFGAMMAFELFLNQHRADIFVDYTLRLRDL